MHLSTLSPLIEAAANLATALGIILAVLVYLHDRKKHRLEKEGEAFEVQNQKWIEILSAFKEYPDFILDFGDLKDMLPFEEKQKIVQLHILISSLEMVYMKYQAASPEARSTHWAGWEDYVGQLFKNPELAKYWRKYLCHGYEGAFVEHIDKYLEQGARSKGPGEENGK